MPNEGVIWFTDTKRNAENVVCCHMLPKIKYILLKIYVVVRVRIVPIERI